MTESVIVNIEYNRLQRSDQKQQLYKLICKEFNISYLWLAEGIEPMQDNLDTSSMARIDAIITDGNEWKLLERLIKRVAKEEDD